MLLAVLSILVCKATLPDTSITQVVRLICDTSENEKILHSDLTSGHLGIKRTIKRIRERFTWKRLNKEVIELVGIRRSICA